MFLYSVIPFFNTCLHHFLTHCTKPFRNIISVQILLDFLLRESWKQPTTHAIISLHSTKMCRVYIHNTRGSYALFRVPYTPRWTISHIKDMQVAPKCSTKLCNFEIFSKNFVFLKRAI